VSLTHSVASDDSSFVNGTDFLVDGGLSACYVVSDTHKSVGWGTVANNERPRRERRPQGPRVWLRLYLRPDGEYWERLGPSAPKGDKMPDDNHAMHPGSALSCRIAAVPAGRHRGFRRSVRSGNDPTCYPAK
jgi:hypothetical protein